MDRGGRQRQPGADLGQHRRLFQHGDALPGPRQGKGCRQAADAGAHDSDIQFLHLWTETRNPAATAAIHAYRPLA